MDKIQIDRIKVAHYQVWPEMATETFAQLVEDVKKNGIAYPIMLDENFVVLDGHHRLKAAKQAGLLFINCIICENLTEEEKLEIAHKTNATSRTLTTADKKKRAVELRAEKRSYRQIAAWLGVGKSTVERWLRGVPAGTSTVLGNDGKEYPSKKPRTAQQEYVDSLRKQILELESEVYSLKDTNRKLSADNITKGVELNGLKLKISGLELDLELAKWSRSFGGGSDNGFKVFAIMAGLPETSTVDEVKRALRKARGKAHPDCKDEDWLFKRYQESYNLFSKLYAS